MKMTNDRQQLNLMRGDAFWRAWVCILFSSSPTSGFTILGEPFGSSLKRNPYVITSPTYLRDFESLIQAATSSANAYPLGGDFAGLAATFDPGNGNFIPVPEHFVPDALIEWGQEPKCLEILVSEEVNGESMARSTITVLPGTGCSIDNLETIKVEDEIDLSSQQWGENSSVVGLQYQISDDEIRLESIFGTDDGHRMRVVIDLIPSESVFAVQSPMVLALERRTNTVSSSGTIADGGGLDGRTVSMLLGEKLRKTKTFAEDQPLEQSFENRGMRHISFPGNVNIAYGWITEHEWVLQVGHMHNGIRRVVSRKFNVIRMDELDYDVESWEEPFVRLEA